MQLNVKGKTICNYSWRRLLYTLCFCMLCVIDQRTKTCTGLDGWLETFRDLTGVVMAVIIMSHYRLEEFKKRKKIYITWVIVSIIAGFAAICWGANNYYFFNDWIVKVIDVVLFGFILLHTFVSVVFEKQCPKLNKKFAAVWLIMMILMIVSRSTYIWPFCYLVIFGCFYLTNYTKDEQEDLFQGMLDGIILAFFGFQMLCCVFRPYDVLRYQGLYHNPNLNALFYLEVLAAVFSKLLIVTKNKANKALRLFYWLGTGVLLACIFMTIGRTAWIVAFVLALIYLWAMKRIQLKNRIIKNGIILVACTLLMFPLCFALIRYIPPLFHHPIWFYGEWGEYRVHSWDAWNSEKYIEVDELLDESLGRIIEGVESILRNSPLAIKANAQELETESALTTEQAHDSILVRKTIYEYYIKQLNLRGHPYSEQGFRLLPTYWIGHAHDIYLQFGTDFGIPVMILLIILVIYSVVANIYQFITKNSMVSIQCTFFILVVVLFGIVEYSWGVGSLTLSMLFIVWRNSFCEIEM